MRLCTFQVHIPWEPSEERALDVACQQWQTNLFGSELARNLELPRQFDAAEHVRWIGEFLELKPS